MWRAVEHVRRLPLAERAGHLELGAGRLTSAKLKLVDACNLRCVMCDYWQGRRVGELTTAEVTSVLRDLAELGCQKVHFTGGEIFLRKDALELFGVASELELLIDLGVPVERIAVVPNAPTITSPVSPREPASGPLALAYVGTLSPWQGLPWAVRALSRLDHPFRLTIRTAAPAWARRELSKLAAKLGMGDKVEVSGPLPTAELAEWLASQDAMLCPLAACERNLVQGGMPLKLLDAMAAGLPVIAPDLPMVTDVLGPELPVYRRHSEASLLELIDELARTPSWRADLGRRGRERARASFAPSLQRARLLDAYRSIAR